MMSDVDVSNLPDFGLECLATALALDFIETGDDWYRHQCERVWAVLRGRRSA